MDNIPLNVIAYMVSLAKFHCCIQQPTVLCYVTVSIVMVHRLFASACNVCTSGFTVYS